MLLDVIFLQEASSDLLLPFHPHTESVALFLFSQKQPVMSTILEIAWLLVCSPLGCEFYENKDIAYLYLLMYP